MSAGTTPSTRSRQPKAQFPAKKLSASETFLERWLKTGRGTPKPTSGVDKIKAAMEELSDSELDDVYHHAIALRRSRGFRFLDLPAEVRNMIYRLCVTPEDIETHVTTGRMPALALLQVNQQIADEFSSLYYSSEYLAVRVFDHGMGMVVKMKNPVVLQGLVARWFRT